MQHLRLWKCSKLKSKCCAKITYLENAVAIDIWKQANILNSSIQEAAQHSGSTQDKRMRPSHHCSPTGDSPAQPSPRAAIGKQGAILWWWSSTSTSECPYKQEESSCWSPRLYKAIYCADDWGQRVLTIQNSTRAAEGRVFAHQCIEPTNLGGPRTEM